MYRRAVPIAIGMNCFTDVVIRDKNSVLISKKKSPFWRPFNVPESSPDSYRDELFYRCGHSGQECGANFKKKVSVLETF